MKKANIWKRLAAGAMTAVLIASGSMMNVSAAPSATVKADVQKKTETLKQKIKEAEGGILPIPYDVSKYSYPLHAKEPKVSLPASFDLRNQGLSTTVKDQADWGACWIFGPVSSLESNILKAQNASGSAVSSLPDYSEMQPAWFTYEPQTAASQKENQAGEGTVFKGRGNRMNAGGNELLAMGTLSTWQGAADESQVPYQTDKNAKVGADKRMLSSVHLQDAEVLPNPALEDIDKDYVYSKAATIAMKQALMQHGALEICYYADTESEDGERDSLYYNYDTNAQYVDKIKTPNHSVTIVGWDDNYSRDHFYEDRKPRKNGAWIVKNSWGDTWGDNGYFYLSYYDNTIAQVVSFRGDAPASDGSYKYDNIYQYDYLGMGSLLGGDDESIKPVSIANVFTAREGETLKAVSAFNVYLDSKVKIDVYKLNAGAVSPLDGQKVSSQITELPYAGYHTIDLIKPVELESGVKFSVVETLTQEDEGDIIYMTPLEYGLEEAFESLAGISQNIKINRGESFLVYPKNVVDVYDYNLNEYDDEGRLEEYEDDEDYDEDEDDEYYEEEEPEILIGNAMIKTFTVNNPNAKKSMASVHTAVAPVPVQPYTGKAAMPPVKVTYKGKALKANADYTVKYSNNVKAGTATVVVTGKGAFTGSRTIRFRIVNPGKVSGVKQTGQSKSAVKLSWKKVKDASGYQVYRSGYKSNAYKKVGTIKNGKTTTYINSKLPSGKLYKYKVRAYISGTNGTKTGAFSNVLKAGTGINAPSLKSVKAGRKKVTIKWSKVSGASGYEVYRSRNNKSWEKAASVKADRQTYTNKKLKSKKNYYYKVRAYKTVDGVKLYSGFTKSRKVKTR